MNKLYLLLIILLGLSLSAAKAQEPLKHEQKFYVNEDGRFYVNRNKPMYLFISNSPDQNSEKHLLKSETSPQYSNPFYFDQDGYNTIRTPWQVDTITKKVILPKKNIIFEVYCDSKAPVSSLDYSEVTKFNKDGKLYLKQNSKFSIKTKDEVVGTEAIYYSIDKSVYTPYSNALSFDDEKDYVLKYYSVDHVGNAEEPKTLEFSVDKSNPQTVHSIDGDKSNDVLSYNCKLTLTASDNLSGISKTLYSIDDANEKTYLYPIKLSSLSEGEHTIKYYSIDNTKNKEEIKSYKFFVDRTPPIVIEEILGDIFSANGREYTSGRTKLKLTAVDNKAGVKSIYYSINSKTYELYDKPFYLPSKTGSIGVKFYAIDNVNNKSDGNKKTSGANSPYIMDLTGPNLNYEFTGPIVKMGDTIFINQDTKIKLKANDAVSGTKKITYSVNKGAEQEYEQPFSSDCRGECMVDFMGLDNVNNTSSKNFKVFVDVDGPDIFAHFSILPSGKTIVNGKSLDTYQHFVALYLAATDAIVGADKIYYKNNEKPERPYSSAIFGFTRGQTYSIQVKGKDKLGNVTEKLIEFAIKE